jgi:hypothetical protein
MAEIKTKFAKGGVKDFIAKVPNETRRKDAEVLLKLFAKATGWKAQMYGPTIVGFGKYEYTYDSGHSGVACVVGFSPRSANLVIYGGMMPSGEKAAPFIAKLGKHKISGGCLHINKLADVDLGQLEKLIKTGAANAKKAFAEKGWPVSGT